MKKPIKKRGPKKGVKRGEYKKTISKKIVIKNFLDKNENDNFLPKEKNNVINEENIIEPNIIMEEEVKEEVKQEDKPEEKKESDVIMDSIINKTDEENFKDFLGSFPNEDIDKVKEAKNKIDSQIAESKEEEEEESKEEEREEERTKRKYTKRNKNTRNEEEEIRESSAMFFNGALLLSLMDFLYPNVIKFVYTKFLKNKTASKITHSQIVLKPEQVESLGDIPDKVSRIIFEKINPLVLFFLFQTVMYTMNFRLALDEQEKLEKEKK